MIGRLHHVIVDCPDPAALAAFYSELLGLPITWQEYDFVVVSRDDTSSGIAFQLAPSLQQPQWPDPGPSCLRDPVQSRRYFPDCRAGRSIVGEGREAGATGADHDEVLAVARAHSATAAQVRIAWTLQQGPHVLAIPGTGNPDHIAENVAASALRLSPDELNRIGPPS